MQSSTKTAIDAAREQVFILRYPTGEKGYYLWGLDGDRAATVRLTAESFTRVVNFLYRDEGNYLGDIDGIMATEDGSDGAIRIPMGARVSVWLSFGDRDWDESPFCFGIDRAA